jgi:hypothetical protein
VYSNATLTISSLTSNSISNHHFLPRAQRCVYSVPFLAGRTRSRRSGTKRGLVYHALLRDWLAPGNTTNYSGFFIHVDGHSRSKCSSAGCCTLVAVCYTGNTRPCIGMNRMPSKPESIRGLIRRVSLVSSQEEVLDRAEKCPPSKGFGCEKIS